MLRVLAGLRVESSRPAALQKWNPRFFHFGAVSRFGHWGAGRCSFSLLPSGGCRGHEPFVGATQDREA